MEGEILKQFSSFEQFIFQTVEQEFKKQALNCPCRKLGNAGKTICTSPRGNGQCKLESCPKIKGEKGEMK